MQIDPINWTPHSERSQRWYNWIMESRIRQAQARELEEKVRVMKMSPQGLQLLVYYETAGRPEKYLTAYWDAHGKVWTIGIGSTVYEDGSPVKKGDKITIDRAYKLVEAHLEKRVYPALNKVLNTTDQGKYDAFADFCYNAGESAFKNSTLLKLHNQKKPADVMRAEFLKWNKSGGKVLPGLICRRMSEAELYNTGKLQFYAYDKKTDKYYKVTGI